MQVRSDSEAALGALGKLGSPTQAVNRIAKEVALDVALSSYGIDVWTHLPGEENKEADLLSRWFEPQAPQAVPCRLAAVERTFPQPRSQDWWIATSEKWRQELGVEIRSGQALSSSKGSREPM